MNFIELTSPIDNSTKPLVNATFIVAVDISEEGRETIVHMVNGAALRVAETIEQIKEKLNEI